VAAIEDLAHDMIQRLGNSNAVARFRHLRAAAQGMNRTIHRLGQLVRRRLIERLRKYSRISARWLEVPCCRYRATPDHRWLLNRGSHPSPTRRRTAGIGSSPVLGRDIYLGLFRIAAIGECKGAAHQRLDGGGT